MSWTSRTVPVWVWLPLILALSWGVIQLKILGDPHRHYSRMLQARGESLAAFSRWSDSVIQAGMPTRQRDLTTYLRALCDSMTADSTLRRTLEFTDFYGPGRLTEGWVALLSARDTASTMYGDHLKFRLDSLTDSIRALLPRLDGWPVSFAAKFRFRDSDNIEVCNPWIRVKLVTLALLDSTGPATGTNHAAAH